MENKLEIRSSVSRIIAFGLFLLMSISGYSQNSKSEFDKLAKQMFVDMNNRDYDAVLEMTHPKVFEFSSKEEMKTVIKSLFEGNEEYSIEIPKKIPAYTTSEIFKGENNLEYGIVVYDMTMKMTFHKQNFDKAGKEMMISIMKAQDMDVAFISDNSLNIVMNNRVTVILKDDATDNKWVMVNYDTNSPLYGKILSSETLASVKKYKEKFVLSKK